MGAAKSIDRVGMTPRRVIWVKRQSKRTMAISEYVKPILVSYLNSEAMEIPMFIAKWGHHWGISVVFLARRVIEWMCAVSDDEQQVSAVSWSPILQSVPPAPGELWQMTIADGRVSPSSRAQGVLSRSWSVISRIHVFRKISSMVV